MIWQPSLDASARREERETRASTQRARGARAQDVAPHGARAGDMASNNMIFQDGQFYVELDDGGYARLPSPLDHLVREKAPYPPKKKNTRAPTRFSRA